MEQYLVSHALRNVWGNPSQDRQLVFAAKRITPLNGALNRFTLMNRKVALPIQGKRYHVFQIGQLNPNLIGFASTKPDWVNESWLNLAQSIESNKMMISLYTADGTCIPRFQTYLLFSNERDLVVAVEDNSRVKIDYKTDQVYFRVYSNAYYESQAADQLPDVMKCKGKIALNVNDILAMQLEVTALRQLTGHVFTYCNGFLVDEISPVTVQIGDAMEYVYDYSVKKMVTFDVNSLNIFSSTLDLKTKFLLHYAGTDDNTIDYQDDLDIYILNPNGARYKGYYYHRNTPESHRMVTHRDYAIVVDYYTYIAQKLAEDTSTTPVDIMGFKLQVAIRKSGTNNRPLIYDNARIFEMYKLDDEKILQAMMGVNSSLEIWKAQSLEANAYTELMRAPYAENVTLSLVQSAYGYNSMSKIVGDTPQKTTLISGRQTATLPEALIGNCTVYEYDVNGQLLGWHYHSGDVTYQAVDNNTRLIEAISGRGTDAPDVRFGTDNIPVPAVDNYRVYRCWFDNGVPNNQWADVTGSSEYHIENGILIWDNEQIEQFVMVRTDAKFLAYDLDLTCVNGNLFFTFAEKEDRGLGDGVQDYTLPVPLGEIDVFLNGHSLIKGLDYNIVFPTIHVVNKKYLNQPGTDALQHLHVRMTGFCSSDLKFEQIDDYGFVQYGFLSENNRYDIRDDKVLRITMDGKTLHRDALLFSEEHDGVSVADPTNGLPYQVKDIVVPLKQLVNENTYSLRAKSIQIDEDVSDYMTIKDPEADRGDLDIIPEKYPVVSPFVSRVLNALLTDYITKTQIENAVTDNDVIALVSEFEPLLQFDPVNEDLEYDYRFVDVHPHRNTTVINLELYQFRFLNRVVGLYCHGLVNLSPFFTVNP